MSRNNNSSRWLIIILVALVAVLFISLFVSTIWNKDNYAPQFIAALLGAIVTTVITLLLLNGQSEQEEKKEKSSKVFEEKLRIYQDFLKTLDTIVKDGKIDAAEEIELEFQTSYLAMHTSPGSINEISDQVKEIIMNIKQNKQGKHNLLDELFKIVKVLQKELYTEYKPYSQSGKEVAQEYDSAISAFQSIMVDGQKVNVYDRVTEIRNKIPRNGINRQWIWQGYVLVHEAYMNGRDSKMNLASDLVFNEDTSAELYLFTRQGNAAETENVLKDKDIWGDNDLSKMNDYGRYPYKSFPKGTTDQEIVDYMKAFVQKMVNYRERHKTE